MQKAEAGKMFSFFSLLRSYSAFLLLPLQLELHLVWQEPAKGGGAEFGLGVIKTGAMAADTEKLPDLFRNGSLAAHSSAEIGGV